MTESDTNVRWRRWGCRILVLGAIQYLAFITHIALNYNETVPRFVPDDALYYLKIADHIAAGQGSTFGGGEPTNGYHPLWMVPLVGLQVLLNPTVEGFVIHTMAMSAVITLIASLALWRLLATLRIPPPGQVLGLSLFLFMPWTAHMTLSCLETPIYLLCLFLFYDCFESLRVSGDRSMAAMLRLGGTAGLLMLARTDSVLITGPLFIWLVVASPSLRHLLRLGVAGTVASLLLAPWLVWTLHTFGNLMQCSGVAMAHIGHLSAGSPDTLSYYLICTGRIVTALYRFFCYPLLPHDHFEKETFSPVLLLVMITCLGGFLLALIRLGWRQKRSPVPLPLLLSTGLIFLTYFYVRTFVQVWHLAILIPLLILGVLAFPRAAHIRPLPCAGVMAVLLTASIVSRHSGYYYPQMGTLERVAILEAAPTRLLIGSTDSGYLGYFTTHEVVNLDGVVNNRALDYIEAGRIQDYIDTWKFDRLLIDEERLGYYNRNLAR